VVYRPAMTSPETYWSTAGPVTVSRHLLLASELNDGVRLR